MRFTAGAVQPFVFRGHGVDATVNFEETVIGRGRLWVDGTGDEVVHQRVRVRKREVLDAIEERELDAPDDS